MRLSKRSQLEVGVLVALIGLFVVIVSAVRFDAYADSDYRYKQEFLPYLIQYSKDYTPQGDEFNEIAAHLTRISVFHPSGHHYSRCPDLVIFGSLGLTILAAGSYICLHGRRRVA